MLEARRTPLEAMKGGCTGGSTGIGSAGIGTAGHMRTVARASSGPRASLTVDGPRRSSTRAAARRGESRSSAGRVDSLGANGDILQHLDVDRLAADDMPAGAVKLNIDVGATDQPCGGVAAQAQGRVVDLGGGQVLA